MVILHGLGMGLVPYYIFIQRLSERYSGELFVPDLPFLAMMPWERVPSAREITAQLQDMLAAHRFPGAHFVVHSFGSIILSWLMKLSPTSIICCTFIEPAALLTLKSDFWTKVMTDPPREAMWDFLRYFVFRELFTVNLLFRNCFWEQCVLWPEEITTPAVVSLSAEDHLVSSFFVRRLLEYERAARKHRKRNAARVPRGLVPNSSAIDFQSKSALQSNEATPLDILWIDGFIHGQILFSRKQTLKLFQKMKQMVQDTHS